MLFFPVTFEKYFINDSLQKYQVQTTMGRKKETLTPQIKESIHLCNVVLSAWWDMRDIVYFETLNLNQTITRFTVSSLSDLIQR